MKKVRIAAVAGIFAMFTTGCSPGKSAGPAQAPKGDTPQGSTGITNGIMKAQGLIPVTVDGRGNIHINAKVEVPVTIVNPANTRFDINTADMSMPTIANTMLEFGTLKIADLFDNDLKVCGANKNKKCGKAYIQIYTTGTPGPGLYNLDGGYGMPIYANTPGTSPLTVGLDAANAAIVHLVNIPNNKNVLRLQDFANAAYEMRSDFTEAGAGSYSTTAVIEYGLID